MVTTAKMMVAITVMIAVMRRGCHFLKIPKMKTGMIAKQ